MVSTHCGHCGWQSTKWEHVGQHLSVTAGERRSQNPTRQLLCRASGCQKMVSRKHRRYAATGGGPTDDHLLAKGNLPGTDGVSRTVNFLKGAGESQWREQSGGQHFIMALFVRENHEKMIEWSETEPTPTDTAVGVGGHQPAQTSVCVGPARVQRPADNWIVNGDGCPSTKSSTTVFGGRLRRTGEITGIVLGAGVMSSESSRKTARGKKMPETF